MSATKARKPSRVRCAICDNLFERTDLTAVGPKRLLCQTCLVAEAESLADAQAVALPDRQAVFELLPDVVVDGWPGRKGRLSPSSLSKFLTCPEQWRRRYVIGDKGPSNGRLIAGTAAHSTAEAFWRHKLDGETLPPSVIRQTARAAFDDALERETQVEWSEPMTQEASKDCAEHMAASYLEAVGERVTPIAMEVVTTQWVAGVPVPVSSVADLLTAKDSRPDAIVDAKFGAQSHTSAGPFWAVQGLVQQIGLDLAVEWHSTSWAGKVSGPWDHQGLRIERTPARYVIATELVRSTYRTIMGMVEMFGLEAEWPGALTNPSACSMCDFSDDCAWISGARFLDHWSFDI